MNDEARWFLAYDGERKGPFTVEQVRAMMEAGAIHATTLAWTRELDEWTPVSDTELGQYLTLAALAPPVPRPDGTEGEAKEPPPEPRKSAWDHFRHCMTAGFVDFGSRARPAEYWSYFLFAVVLAVASLVLVVVLLEDEFEGLALLVLGAYFVGMVLPGLAVTVRRFHDVGMPGWLLLLWVIPGAQIVVLIIMLLPSQLKDNQWGPGPRKAKPEAPT